MTTPKVSIIVPCYRVEKYLNRCLNSLVNQTLKDIEIILVDDGSPDRVPEMCDDWAAKDSRIKVIHKQNAGLGFARNSGLDIATGEYVAFVDSDDYVDTMMYKALYAKAKNGSYDYVSSNHFYKRKTSCDIANNYITEEKIYRGRCEIDNIALGFVSNPPNISIDRYYSMSVWHGLYKNDLIQKHRIRFYSEREVLSEDLPFQVDFFTVAESACFLPIPYYYYCQNLDSLTQNFTPSKFDCAKRLYMIIEKKISRLDTDGQRTSRLFIAYTRMLVCACVTSNNMHIKEKLSFLRFLTEDCIWDNIKYQYANLCVSKRIMYYLIVQQKWNLLYIYSYIYKKGKLLLNKV